MGQFRWFDVADRWLTFDCFGTLIDWRHGIRTTGELLFPGRGAEFLEAYSTIEAEVELVELLGAENLVTLKLGEHELKARFAPDVRPAAGTRLRMALDPARFHLFDTGSGLAL